MTVISVSLPPMVTLTRSPHTETDNLSSALLPCLGERQKGSGQKTLLLCISGTPLTFSRRIITRGWASTHTLTQTHLHRERCCATEEKSRRDGKGEQQTEKISKLLQISTKTSTSAKLCKEKCPSS